MAPVIDVESAEVMAKLLHIAKTAPARLGAGLYRTAQPWMTEAKRRTPVDTGTLRASGDVDRPVYSGNEVAVAMRFGGSAQDYAIKVHEDLHQNHPRGGQAKFLESVVNEHAGNFAHEVAGNIILTDADADAA